MMLISTHHSLWYYLQHLWSSLDQQFLWELLANSWCTIAVAENEELSPNFPTQADCNCIPVAANLEFDAIKLATLHLDGEAHEWWYHRLVTLGHASITFYMDFTQRLIERFDKKDPEIHFRVLAQLKQTGSLESYISEFYRVGVMVTDITEPRLIMLFTEGLAEPLRGWVKAYKPATLQDAISGAKGIS
jgi:hypothetical protein